VAIDKETVIHVAKLARLTITSEEATHFTEQLDKILIHIETLNRLNTADVEPTSHVLSLSNVFREDGVRPSLSLEEALGGAPEKAGPHFRVPKIIE